MYQYRLHTDEDDGGQRTRGAPGTAGERLRRDNRALEHRSGRVRERKRNIVTSFRQGTERSIEKTEGLELLRGEARFTGPHSIEVTGPAGESRTLEADRIFINTGTRAVMPAALDAARVTALDSASIMELDRLPDHLLVIGGGYIGLEFGQMFRRFGSRVTIIQRSEQLLPREDPDVADKVASILSEDGVEVLLGSEATGATKKPRIVYLTQGDRVANMGAWRQLSASSLSGSMYCWTRRLRVFRFLVSWQMPCLSDAFRRSIQPAGGAQ